MGRRVVISGSGGPGPARGPVGDSGLGPWGLNGSGAPAPALLLPEAVAKVLAVWPAEVSDATVARVSAVLERFGRWCEAAGRDTVTGVTGVDVAAFVTAPLPGGQAPSPATMDGRRAAVRILFRELRAQQVPVGDPTIDVQVPGRLRRGAQPLTDEEVLLGRRTAQLRSAAGGGYAVVGWALAEAGAVTSEIAQVRVRDLDDPVRPGRVRLAGTRRHDPRSRELTGWGSEVLGRRVGQLRAAGRNDDALLAYRGQAAAGSPASQSAVCTALRAVLLQAGIAVAEDVRPASIRHWAGRSRYEAGMPIEQVARWLGMRSLDAVVFDLAIEWRSGPRPPSAPPAPPLVAARVEGEL